MYIQLTQNFYSGREGDIFSVMLKVKQSAHVTYYLVREIELQAIVGIDGQVVYVSPHFDEREMIRDGGQNYKGAWVASYQAHEITIDLSSNEEAAKYGILKRFT